jgi:hypothetical protein
VVIINTRWHEDDVSGRILPANWAGESGDILCRDGNTWRVLCLQAECQTPTDPLGRAGRQMLWPEWFDKKHWDQFRLNRRTWSSLYQQLPAPADGILFRKDDMAVYDDAPPGLRIIGGSDYAVTPDGGDWTEHGIAGIARRRRPVPARLVARPDRARGLDRAEDRHDGPWKPLMRGSARPGRSAARPRARCAAHDRALRELPAGVAAVDQRQADARAADHRDGRHGALFWPRAAWVPELQRQCLVFPAGSPDDGVDCLGQLGRGAATIGRRRAKGHAGPWSARSVGGRLRPVDGPRAVR